MFPKKTLIGSESDRISGFFHGMALSVPLSQNIQILISGAHDIAPRLIDEPPLAFDLDAGETGGEGGGQRPG